jgi:uncharacterized membrane protein YdjX (TVP38/TMEM64 family)
MTETPAAPPAPPAPGRLRWAGWVLLGLGVLALGRMVPLAALLGWARGAGAVGVVAYGLLYGALAVAGMPCVLLSMLAGFAFGPWVGGLAAYPGAMLAGAVSFGLGRRFGQTALAGFRARSPRWTAIEHVLAGDVFRLSLLMRLSPLFPFALVNLAAGASEARFAPFFVGTSLGMVPGVLLYAQIGALAPALDGLLRGELPPSPQRLWMALGGILASAVVVFFVGRQARRALASVQP